MVFDAITTTATGVARSAGGEGAVMPSHWQHTTATGAVGASVLGLSLAIVMVAVVSAGAAWWWLGRVPVSMGELMQQALVPQWLLALHLQGN